LEEPAGLADGEAEGELRLGPGEILGSEEIVGEGLEAEIEDEFAVSGIAGAAMEVGVRHGETLPFLYRLALWA
jgi:hypothetical protein